MGLITRPTQLRLLPGVPSALVALRSAGFRLVVVTNQAIVARGLATREEVRSLNRHLAARLTRSGAVIDAWYFCPHHPQATLRAYRGGCACRKPRPGMLHMAAARWQLDLTNSYMVGDRLTDVQAGAIAGCRTVWVQTGDHHAAPIVADTSVPPARPDHTCRDLPEAAAWILSQGGAGGGLRRTERSESRRVPIALRRGQRGAA